MYILVVDDEKLSRELTMVVLQSGGYEVEAVDNPRGAIRMIERRLPDLLILDAKMPEMTGFAFAEENTRGIFLFKQAKISDPPGYEAVKILLWIILLTQRS